MHPDRVSLHTASALFSLRIGPEDSSDDSAAASSENNHSPEQPWPMSGDEQPSNRSNPPSPMPSPGTIRGALMDAIGEPISEPVLELVVDHVQNLLRGS